MPTKKHNFPRINVLYFKNLIDRCFVRFFHEYSDSFVKQEDETYLFASPLTHSSLKQIFDWYFRDELTKYVVEYSESNPEFLFIIGSCIPSENFVLNFVNPNEKLLKIINVTPDLRYFLKEDDISVDMRLFNDVFEEMFSGFMRKKPYRNVFFLRHNSLDCYFLFKTIKQIYGSLVVNLHKKNNLGDDRCIYSINEEIDKICNRKLEILKSNEILPIKEEIYRYIDSLIGEV